MDLGLIVDGALAVVGAASLVLLVILLRGLVAFRPWFKQTYRLPAATRWERDQARDDALADEPSAEQIYFDSAQRELDTQIATSGILDTKAMSCITVGSTVLPLTFGLLALSRRPANDAIIPPLPVITIMLFAVAVIFYILLLAAAVRALNIRALEFHPDLKTLQGHARSYDGGSLRRWVAEEYATSAAINGPVLVIKARTVGAATWLLFGETLLISIAGAAALLL